VLRIELPGRAEEPMPMRGVCHGLPLFRSEVSSVTMETGVATQLTLAWDGSGLDQRILAYEQGPRSRTLTVYTDSFEAAAHLGDAVFSFFVEHRRQPTNDGHESVRV